MYIQEVVIGVYIQKTYDCVFPTGLTKFTNSSEKRTALGSCMDNNSKKIFTLAYLI